MINSPIQTASLIGEMTNRSRVKNVTVVFDKKDESDAGDLRVDLHSLELHAWKGRGPPWPPDFRLLSAVD